MLQGGWQLPAEQPVGQRAFVRVELGRPPHDPEYPLTLVTGRLLYDRGTRLLRSERIQNLVPDAFIMIHPTDAKRLDLSDGDAVSVESTSGRLGLSVRVSDEIVPGAAFAPLNLSSAPLSALIADRWTPSRVRIVK
jgi:predicted molibdopterin-dependent oxidoreductase YjgC